MYSSQSVFLIVFFFCYVHTYRSEYERTPYEPSAEEPQDHYEEYSHRVERSAEEGEIYAEEEVFEPKGGKKSEHSGDSYLKDGHKSDKKPVSDSGVESAADDVYSKESKNVNNKKGNGKKYNKKYESGKNGKRHDLGVGDKAYEEPIADSYETGKPSHKRNQKRNRRSEEYVNVQPSDKGSKSTKPSEAEPTEEVSQESKPVKQKQKTENTRKSKSGKDGKQTKKKSGSKKDKRSYAYFGLWA